MAKAIVDGTPAEKLDAGQRKTLATLKRPVMDAARQFGVVREKLADLAPRVIRFFTNIQATNERFSFVEFCRLFDPAMPTRAGGEDGYRNHPTYYTLNYMRRIIQNAGGQRQRQQGVRNNATDALARTLATVLQLVEDDEAIYKGIQQEFGWGERIMTRLRKRVADTKPLFKIATPKPLKVNNVIHMEQAKQDRAEPMQQQGARVVLPTAEKTGRKRAAA